LFQGHRKWKTLAQGSRSLVMSARGSSASACAGGVGD
jgi:hypothetical protein